MMNSGPALRVRRVKRMSKRPAEGQDQQLVDIRKSQRMMCVSYGESTEKGKTRAGQDGHKTKNTVYKRCVQNAVENEMWNQRLADTEIDGLLTINLSNAS